MHAKKVNFLRILPLFLKGFVPISLFIAGLGFWYVHEQKAVLMAYYEVEANHHVEGQMKRVQRFYKHGIAVLLSLARDRSIPLALEGNVEARRAMANAFTDIMDVSELYSQIRLLDTTGWEVVRVNREDDHLRVVPDGQLQNKGLRNYVQQTLALSGGSIYVSPFDLNMEYGEIERPYKAVTRFATPLMNANGVRNGLLVINMLGISILENEMHETALKGEHLLFNAGSSCWFDSHLQQLQVMKDMNTLIQIHRLSGNWFNAIKGENGQIITADGLFTFERINPLLGHGMGKILRVPRWEIISFVPVSALHTALSKTVSMTLQFCAVVIVLFATSIWFWAGHRVLKVSARKQQESLHATRRQMLHRLIEAREDERSRLARSLHDEIAQDLVAIQIQADLIANKRLEGEQSTVNHEAQLIQKMATGLIGIVRSQLNELRPAQLDTLGLKAALEVMCSSLDAGNGMRCRMQIDDAVDTLSETLKLNIYRIVQEALRNIERYADASNVMVSLTIEGNMVNFFVEDDGVGFDVDIVTNGLGLVGMRERCALLRGKLEVDSKPGVGTCLRMHVPACFSDA